MQNIIIITNKDELRSLLHEVLAGNNATKQPNFKTDRLTREQAAELIGISLPTFSKWVKARILKEHGHGRKKFFLRSEIIDALKK